MSFNQSSNYGFKKKNMEKFLEIKTILEVFLRTIKRRTATTKISIKLISLKNMTMSNIFSMPPEIPVMK
ncbi:hypothetical protein CR513_59479, partial [Mucuna pruriens]